eukprot:CAMPEP_0181041314 /NCGR_PEP_ID=MMETSP1070-20121207/11531_1 /TAXON_ID=265543 /ORGANISM="Minutocellus polymorphus, Strain NH13" /LENGTH=53 /DNA_ID=CAMNT_0023119413 /DNA_START=498 /DNA_END=659 /DNA_ORIENTATION=+
MSSAVESSPSVAAWIIVTLALGARLACCIGQGVATLRFRSGARWYASTPQVPA